MWYRQQITLKPYKRGFHLITNDILSSLDRMQEVSTGLLHLQMLHTSASLTLNENADPDVRHDMEAFFRDRVPGDLPYFRHTMEGPDDMPAHIKASLMGTELTLAVDNGRLATGTWQGIWLGEHRENGGSRRILATLYGE
ncbi:secondary thiamine-phosphate synthase enzyme YjbQ [Kushneria indalinina]|uniref:Secondary thiamine-phosphate synthase enzyme n=1 Tax=Kushneria indalinina DSM 14324 TaxID=1122140 RepID=A0A3D9E0H3_9GAMM|nr:secondary thiamine-phosphate synthase enzyme YjbQ [Kushneria indalinina]REC96405.1 secondary thiamine-phosphate synthase enzyme [Kushneria indalinina DSM 14324]